MLEIRPEIKEPRKVELWGVIIITCFNLAFLTAAVTQNLGLSVFYLLLVLSQGAFVYVCAILLRIYRARAGIDEMHDATIARNKTLEILAAGNERPREIAAAIKDLSKEVRELKEILSSLKNLPP